MPLNKQIKPNMEVGVVMVRNGAQGTVPESYSKIIKEMERWVNFGNYLESSIRKTVSYTEEEFGESTVFLSWAHSKQIQKG